MSGGSFNYLFRDIQEAADILSDVSEPAYRRAFSEHLRKVAEAMQDVEWVDSGDMSPGADEKSIMECITPQDVLCASVERAVEVKNELEKLIGKCGKKIREG